jgi:hypothetical protein
MLSLLSKVIEKYFLSLEGSSLDWVGDPFVLIAFEPAELTVAEEDMTEIRKDRSLKVKHPTTDMASFWLSRRQEYLFVTKRAIEAFLFSTSYLCDAGICAVNTMKARKCRSFKHWRRT